nr:hypothetical protein Iba_chr12cCG11200 [Ipomoea batatas]GMD68190.1 hypothetical protein Iba_chr12dCG6800 [Ipomoea batatas]
MLSFTLPPHPSPPRLFSSAPPSDLPDDNENDTDEKIVTLSCRRLHLSFLVATEHNFIFERGEVVEVGAGRGRREKNSELGGSLINKPFI